MGEIVNLRRVRKAKRRAEQDASAETNRLVFGRSKAERRETALRAAQTERLLDGHRREKTGDDA